jgi:hypothetical protein
MTIVFCFKVTSEFGSNPYRGFAVVFPGCTDYKAIPWANFQNFGRILLFFLNCEPLLQAFLRELAAFNTGHCVITMRTPIADFLGTRQIGVIFR